MIAALKQLFPSDSETQKRTDAKKREHDLARRAMMRRLQSTLGQIDGVCTRIDQQRRDSIEAARKALAEGDRAAAERHVRSAQGRMVMTTRMEKQRWVFENIAMQAEIGLTEQSMVDMMKEVAVVSQLNPASVDAAMQDVRAFIEQANDVGQALITLSDEEQHAVKREGAGIPSVEEMMRTIADEVAREIRTDDRSSEASVGSDSVSQRIGEGRAKIEQLLEGLK